MYIRLFKIYSPFSLGQVFIEIFIRVRISYVLDRQNLTIIHDYQLGFKRRFHTTIELLEESLIKRYFIKLGTGFRRDPGASNSNGPLLPIPEPRERCPEKVS